MASTEKNTISKNNSPDRSDLVAYWSVPLYDGVHTVEFEHGTTTGKRVLRVDGDEILRRDWMFRLVGDEKFTLGPQKVRCELLVDPIPNFAFSYSLLVDGKPLEKFTEKQNRNLRSWAVLSSGKRYRVVLEKQTLDIWVNGEKVEVENSFTNKGTEMRFLLDDAETVVKATATDKKEGVIHDLYVNGNLVTDDSCLQQNCV